MALAQLLLSMEPKYICHKLCTMGTSSPMVPILSTEILPIPAFTKSYGEVPLKYVRKVFFFQPSLFEFELQQKLFFFEGSHYAYR